MRIEPFGPGPEALGAVSRLVMGHAATKKLLQGTRHRLLFTSLVEPESQVKPLRASPPTAYRATIFDYTNNRTVFADGLLGERGRVSLTESGQQPRPTSEEMEHALKLVRDDAELGPLLREGRLRPYRPMPPLVEAELPDGRVERTISVGLLPEGQGVRHQIVGVNLIRDSIERFDGGAPPTAQAHNPICGLPDGNQSTTSSSAGQVWVTVTQGNTTLWKFLVVRPAASSGTNGAGVELRFVDYRGKRVLYRAHVPILNVKYDNDACGPYRDWQDQEGMLQATGTDVGSGFRLCPAPATTILDTGSDTGNFLGVAIYLQGQEVVLVSEMEAGWYRYISQWHLHTDGTIRARFGFSAVQSSCVCTRHHHHAYWRLDFDIQTAGNNIVREFNDPPLVGSSNWHQKLYEIRRSRNPARQRKWRVEHATSGRGYDVIPGPADGVATASPDWPFPQGDVWILRYHGSEIDDGSVATGPPYEAQLDSFKNGESLDRKDVVLWYAAHFSHDIATEPPGTHGHVVGPDLKPVNW